MRHVQHERQQVAMRIESIVVQPAASWFDHQMQAGAVGQGTSPVRGAGRRAGTRVVQACFHQRFDLTAGNGALTVGRTLVLEHATLTSPKTHRRPRAARFFGAVRFVGEAAFVGAARFVGADPRAVVVATSRFGLPSAMRSSSS
jgi:hypothetical protein